MKPPTCNPYEVLEWMEGFLRCYPSNSVHNLIKSFKEEMNENEWKHRIYMRRVPQSKPRTNMLRISSAAGVLYKALPLPLQPTEGKS